MGKRRKEDGVGRGCILDWKYSPVVNIGFFWNERNV